MSPVEIGSSGVRCVVDLITKNVKIIKVVNQADLSAKACCRLWRVIQEGCAYIGLPIKRLVIIPQKWGRVVIISKGYTSGVA